MDRKIVSTGRAPAAIGPYSQGVVYGGLLFVSGQIPINPATGAVVEGGIREQARQVLENVKQVLLAAGSGLGNVLKTTVFIKDMNDFAAVNEVYGEYFTENFPARSCVEVSRLPKDVLIEMEVIAAVE